MSADMENTTKTKGPPDWIIASAHRKADETGIEHAVTVHASRSPHFGAVGCCWVAVPLGSTTDEQWLSSPYVAVPGELGAAPNRSSPAELARI